MLPLLDISVGLNPTLPVWPGSPGIRREAILDRQKGDPVNATKLTLDVHCGTHIDAPRHFIDGGDTVEAIHLDRLNGAAFVASVSGAKRIGPAELERAAIPAETKRLLLRTDNSDTLDLYVSPFREDYCALSPAGAEWVRDRGIDVIGVDYLSVQRYDDPPDAHVTILGAAIVIIEGLNLARALPGWYDMICLPIALDGAEAAPARVALGPLKEKADR